MVTIMGNVSQQAETRLVTGKNGQKTMVTDFSVAENIGYGDTKDTIFYRVSIWGTRGANLAPHLTKGKGVYLVANKIKASPYIYEKDGEKIPAASLEVSRILEFRLYGKKVGETDTVFDGDEVEE